MTDQATTQVAAPVVPPVPGSPEYDAAMAAKYDAAQAQSTPPARPEWLPEKFSDPADLAKAYKELEKKLGAKAPEAPVAAPKAEDKATTQAAPADAATEAAKAATGEAPSGEALPTVDFQAITTEFISNGALSEATYETLAKAGISKELTDSYIAGQQAAANAKAAEAFKEAGGEKEYAAMVKWGATNLPEADIDVFNAGVNGSQAAMKMAVSALKARYEAAYGRDPQMLGGAPAPSAQGYSSLQEQTRDIRNPLYKTDPAFRQKVQDKIARSNY